MRYGSGSASLAFSPDGKTLAATCDKGLALWDAATGKPVTWFPPNGAQTAAAFTPDGKTLITYAKPLKPGPDFRTEQRSLQHCEVGTGKLLSQFEMKRQRGFGSSEFPFLSSDGRFLIHTNGDEIVVWDAMARKVHARVQEKPNYWAPLALTRDGKTLVVVRQFQRNVGNGNVYLRSFSRQAYGDLS